MKIGQTSYLNKVVPVEVVLAGDMVELVVVAVLVGLAAVEAAVGVAAGLLLTLLLLA